MNPAIATTWEQRLADLGNIPMSRVFSGEDVLPGWTVDCEELYGKLDQQAPS